MIRFVTATFLCGMLGACGGGGGGGGSDSAVAQGSQTAAAPGSAAASSAGSAAASASSTSSASSIGAAPAPGASSSSAASASSSTRSVSSSAASSTASSAAGSGVLTSGFTAFYVDPASQARQWVTANPNDYRAASISASIASQASGKWFGEWSGAIASAVGAYTAAAQAAGKVPVLIAYNIPSRDCGSYSAGGSAGGDAYKSWISAFAGAIGNRPAIVILEPDALMQLDCLPSDDDRSARLALLNYAVDQFAARASQTLVYLDAGHSAWKSPTDTATRLIGAGVARARGFALNVSNYRADSELESHGNAVMAQLQAQGGFTRPYVIDTSRNGNGPLNSEWCDPAGRRIGLTSRVLTLGSGLEMKLWLKAPGEADGCAAGAGVFVPDLAYRLVTGS